MFELVRRTWLPTLLFALPILVLELIRGDGSPPPLEQPLRTLCDNADVEGSVIVEKVKGVQGRGEVHRLCAPELVD